MAPCFEKLLRTLGRTVIGPERPAARQHGLLLPMLVREAVVSIGNNRLRTVLAMLGIVIGVASVVAMLGLGNASKHRIEAAINTLGSNVLIVTSGGSRVPFHERKNLDIQDVNAIADLALAEDVAYSSLPAARTVYANDVSVDTRIMGTAPEFLSIRNWRFDDGNVFTSDDMRQGKRVVVIGNSLAERLLPGGNPLGRSIAIGDGRARFQVVGILESKGPGLGGDDQDNIAFVPISTFKTHFASAHENVVQLIYARAGSADTVPDLTEDIRDVLRQRHKIPEARADSFTIQNVNAVMQVASETTRALTLLLAAIASISLIVGGIGIMNIMLVTVSERTREIGLRKAIGATEQQILVQFLLEAVFISGAGSLAGLVLGIAGGIVAESWLAIPMEVSPWAAALALGMSIGIGLPSGIYPAYRAAKLEPIEALRAVGG